MTSPSGARVHGIDVERVSARIDEHIDGAVGPYEFSLIAGKHSKAQRMLTPDARATASRSLIDTMAAIHAVDLEAAGLGQLGRHEGYIARQLKRWYGQWNSGKTRELTAVDEAHDQLSRLMPDQGPATIVHGDYRLDNCMVDDDGNVVAVLDWEICTLGDPLADRYAEVSGRDFSRLDFYVAFAYWKLACILEGVDGRYLGGALGDVTSAELEPFKLQVDAAAAMSISALERVR